jgi:hypothetical protein
MDFSIEFEVPGLLTADAEGLGGGGNWGVELVAAEGDFVEQFVGFVDFIHISLDG